MTAAAESTRQRERLLALLAIGIVLVLAVVAVPFLLREETRDWVAYEQAAARLVSGGPLYIWHLATPEDEYYLYPPGLAAAWSVAGSPVALLALKIAALASVAVLAPLVRGPGGQTRLIGVALAVGALIWPADVHDLILGNVMALYVGAAAIVIARRGWLGAAPLGLVIALAAKPVVIPLLLWLAVRRRGDAVRVVGWAALVSGIVAAAVGPGRYLEYLGALPHMTSDAASFTGNVGLVTVSPILALAGIACGWIAAIIAGARFDARVGAAVALAAMLVAQPTIGFNYGGLLFPAMALLVGVDRRAGALAFAIGTPLMFVSPVGTAVGVIAVGSWLGTRRATPEPVAA